MRIVKSATGRHTASVLTALSFALAPTAVAACGGGTAPGAGTPAVSKQQAESVLNGYQAANNRANRTLNDSLLATVETGPQLAMDSASYKLHRVTKERLIEFSFAKPVYYIPRLTSYPRWFVVDAASAVAAPVDPHNRLRHALLFRQQTAGAPWLLAADPFPIGSGTPLSNIAVDGDGYAIAVTPDAGHLTIPPGKIPPAHAELLTAGPAASGARGLTAGPQTSEAYNALQQARGGYAKLGVSLTSQFTPASEPVYALRATDGGALVWYVLQQKETYATSKPGGLSIAGDLVGLAPAGPVGHRLDTTVLIQYLAKVPAKGTATISGMNRKAVQAVTS